jgi:diguanylate cyclase (GGDEF)-like protein
MTSPADREIVCLLADAANREWVEAKAGAASVTLVTDVPELCERVQRATCAVVVVDGEVQSADEATGRLARMPERSRWKVICASREILPASGADIIALWPAVGECIEAALRPAAPWPGPVLDIDRLLQSSLLGGALDQLLAVAADDLAAAFDADRGVISVRGQDSGGLSGERTLSSFEWDQVAVLWQVAAVSGATVIVPSQADESSAGTASYLAVPLGGASGAGFIGLEVDRPHLFSHAQRSALAALAQRLGAEVAWRAVHDRLVDDLDRAAQAPAVDPFLGVWNRPALEQLTAMRLSAARRGRASVIAMVLDVVQLNHINQAFGVAAGDAILRRLSSGLRSQVREEDVVGRWSGDELAVIFDRIAPESAGATAERLLSSLLGRPLELPGSGATVHVSATIGVAEAAEGELPEQLLTRAARAAGSAQQAGKALVSVGRAHRSGLSQELEAVPSADQTTLGGAFRLLHEISRGGMGVVYRAEDLALERPVAIKMLRSDLGVDPQLSDRFRREAAMLAHLRHPNLVQIYSYGTHDDESYFAMELVEGESLERSIERGRLEGSALSLGDVAELMTQVASALDALHERGIIHRDVKPANVILDPFRGRAVLVDVGIAHQHEQRGSVAGTPGFVAPEVIDGQEATSRADVYGLAATAYHTLTLHPPWSGDGAVEILTRQKAGGLRPASEWRPELAPVDGILAAAMSVDPKERPESAGAFARALSAALAELAGSRGEAEDPAAVRVTDPELLRLESPGAVLRTRGLVFRSTGRLIGIRETESLRDAVSESSPELCRALSQETAPLAWVPTALFLELLKTASARVDRDPLELSRDLARAALRTSFRRFFPASSATLVPDNSLSAIRSIWARYQDWGSISSMPVHGAGVVVRITDKPAEPLLCAWAVGLLEQLVLLSGGRGVSVHHHACDARGDAACLFRVTWERQL